jgi:hypothetical protein
LHHAKVSARSSKPAARPPGGQRAAVSAHAPALVAIQPLEHLAALLSIRQPGHTQGGECRCLNPTLRSSGRSPEYRCPPLNSNVSCHVTPRLSLAGSSKLASLPCIVLHRRHVPESCSGCSCECGRCGALAKHFILVCSRLLSRGHSAVGQRGGPILLQALGKNLVALGNRLQLWHLSLSRSSCYLWLGTGAEQCCRHTLGCCCCSRLCGPRS